MRRGTTPPHIFTLPFDTSLIAKLRINYAQNDKLVLVKTETDVSLDGNTVYFKLTQEETLGFTQNRIVEIQLDVLTVSGDSLKSDIYEVSVERCLNGEVLK